MGFKIRMRVAALLCLLPLTAWSWGSAGHQVVALIAQSQLSPQARVEVERLLALEPGETLASVSTWADEHRNPASARWHYVNFPRDSCTFDEQRDCPDGKCVVAAIERAAAVLASDAPDDKRLAALKYLVHLEADVHQPLHAGYLDDKGGNTYQLQAFMRGSNLHALWDTGLIRNLDETPQALATRLVKAWANKAVANLNPVHAAQESCRIVAAEGYYPERRVGLDYIEKYTPLVEQRLWTAGWRLAGLLNAALR